MDAFFSDYLNNLLDYHRDFETTFSGLPAEALDYLPGSDMNSLAVLVVHTMGATRFWFSDVFFAESSARDRDAEFRTRHHDAAALKARIADTESFVRAQLARLTPADLPRVCDVPGRGVQRTVGWGLLHVLKHTGLHLGHAQLTRQLWEQRGG